jgi:hypothetical protein
VAARAPHSTRSKPTPCIPHLSESCSHKVFPICSRSHLAPLHEIFCLDQLAGSAGRPQQRRMQSESSGTTTEARRGPSWTSVDLAFRKQFRNRITCRHGPSCSNQGLELNSEVAEVKGNSDANSRVVVDFDVFFACKKSSSFNRFSLSGH